MKSGKSGKSEWFGSARMWMYSEARGPESPGIFQSEI